ncbi:MAG: type II toxin-antitoxin system Phd/YefM family antitoxin [Chitinispirillia bacterium]|nr:type II toxin-antitoxin system Phd/YefM family antitoxin [Chitinispirillia bacterium]
MNYHIPVSEFKNEISETLNRVAYSGDSIALQRHGKDVAVIISVKKYELLEHILERMEDEEDIKDALKAREEIKSGKDKVIKWDDVKGEFGF